MGHEKDCLYSPSGSCVLTNSVNQILSEVRSDFGNELNDDQILKMIEKRSPKEISPHASTFSNLVKGSACGNCSLKEHV
jgi:hypothetical protein